MYAEYQAETYFLLSGREGHASEDDAFHARAGDAQKSAGDEPGYLDVGDNKPRQYRAVRRAS